MSLSISKKTVSALKYTLKIKTQHKKIFVVDGLFSFPLNITNDSITCSCKMSRESGIKIITDQSDHQFCKHIIYYLYYRGLDVNLLPFWPKLKQSIFTELQSIRVNNMNLWTIVDKEIQYADCRYCSQQIKDITNKFDPNNYKNIHMCSNCNCFSHESCFRQWIENEGECMNCKSNKKQELVDTLSN